MERIPHTTDPIDESHVREVFEFYLDRQPAPETVISILDRRRTLGQLENQVLSSHEYRQKGPLMATTQRSPWDRSILLLEAAKVLFCPIAKVANTSVKDWVLRLSGYNPEPNKVHTMLDRGEVKLQARYQSGRRFDAIIRDPEWARTAILRDPLDRLISCYWDKFVRTRNVEAVLYHTLPVYQFIYGEEKPTAKQIDRGITFRQFCHYINLMPREQMDPHWAPQSRYLETFRWNHLFSINRIDAFERFVLDRCPPELQDIRLNMHNVAPRNDLQGGEQLADRPPIALQKYSKLPNAALVTPDIEDFIRDYYAIDYQLLAIAEG